MMLCPSGDNEEAESALTQLLPRLLSIGRLIISLAAWKSIRLAKIGTFRFTIMRRLFLVKASPSAISSAIPCWMARV